MALFFDLPNEIRTAILDYLDLPSIATCRQASREFKELSKDRSLWTSKLHQLLQKLDAPIIEYGLDAIKTSSIESEVTAPKRFSQRLRDSDSLVLRPCSIRTLQAPLGNIWRASAICSCGRWLALLWGEELQIWSLATPTIVLMTSLRVDLIEDANDLWINWIYSSEDRMLIIVLQTARPEIHRHIVCELSVKPRPTLRLRGSLQTPLSTYTPVDLPDNPLLLVDMVADRAQVWYPDTGRLIAIDEGQILPGYVMKRRGVIVRFGDNETSMTVTRLPLLPASMASTSPSLPTTNLSLPQIQPAYQFDYEEEIRSFESTHGTLLLIDRSKIYISRDPSEPLFRWVVLTRYGGIASEEDASDEHAITTGVHPIVFWHKGLYVNEETGESRLETLAIDEASEGIFPTSYLPSRPILDFGDEWFLWWPEASVVPDVDDGDEKPGVRIALYLFSSNGENATDGDKREKKDVGRFLKVGNVGGLGDFAEKVIEFDPISGRCVCFDGAQVVVFEFI